MIQVWQDWSHVEGLQIQRNECFRSWRRVGRDGMHRNGKHRFERIGDRNGSDCFERVLWTTSRCSRRPAKAKRYGPASGKLLPNLGARKVQVKFNDGSLEYVNLRIADMPRASRTVSEMNDMGHDVFFFFSLYRQKHQGVCVPRGQCVRVAGRTCSVQPEYVEERHSSFVFFTFCFGTDQGDGGQGCECGPPKLTGACRWEFWKS